MVPMNATLIPLHIHVVGMNSFLPGLLALLLVLGLFRILRRRGRLGPVRWDPRRAGSRAAHGEADARSSRSDSWTPPATHPEDAALTLLKERLATGEITPQEYLERSSVLRHEPPSA